MGRPIKYIDIQEFSDLGWVQEINRRFLHPAGLAMSWTPAVNAEAVKDYIRKSLPRRSQKDEAVIDAMFEMLDDLGYVKAHLTGVWDDRDDEEGDIFGEDFFEEPIATEMRTKAANVQKTLEERAPKRAQLLGYVVQPLPAEPSA